MYKEVKLAFSALGEAFYPLFSTIYGIVAPVGKILFSLAQALGLVGSAVSSNAFKTFGEIIGWLVGTPLKMLAWGIKIILSPIEMLGKFVGMVLKTGSGLLASGLGLKDFGPTPGVWGLEPALAATPAVTTVISHQSAVGGQTHTADFRLPTADQNLRRANLLAEKNTYYYQTFNNQRAESTSITQPPAATPDQRPLEVKLNLDGREIYRSMVNQEREYGVRNNG